MTDNRSAAVEVHSGKKSFGEVVALDGLDLEVDAGTL